MKEERPKQVRHSRSPDLFAIRQVGSFVWRGAVGGVLGVIALIVYRLFTNPYLLGGPPTDMLISAVNGMLVGAVIWFLGRLFGKDLGVVWRILSGTLFSSCSMGLYSYLEGGYYGDRREFVSNAILLALTFGGFAGALARGKSRQESPKEDHAEHSAGHDGTPSWSYLWRGAVGGALGAVGLIIYRFFTNPFRSDSLLIAVLISAGNGVFVGASIWLLRRLLGRNPGVASRMLAGTLFSFCSIAFYLYLEGGLNGDIKPFMINTAAVGLMLGAPAGAIAKGRPELYKLS